MKLFSDAPISAIQFDVLGRKDVAMQLVELVALAGDQQPLVTGLVGPSGCGKTSVLYMVGELLADRDQVRAFSIDAWTAGTAASVNDGFLREISRIFSEGRVTGGTEKVRDRLSSVGDMVSTVARFAGVKVDVRGALERSPDQLRDEVLKFAEALGKRIVVFIDHLDRLPGAEAVALLKLIERWGSFPYFAFVIAFDRDQVAHNLAHVDGDADALERIVTTELAMPPADRARLAAQLRGGLADLAASLGVDPAPVLALFEIEDGVGLGVVTNVRQAKRLLNSLVAVAPLHAPLELRTICLLELIRQRAPAAYRLIADRMPLDANTGARLRTELARLGSSPVPAPVEALLDVFFANQV